MTITKLMLDIDTGIDDALAILLALNSPELELIGCSTVAGNTTVDQATINTISVLDVAGRTDIPVAKGAAHPLTRRLTTATHFHGPKGMGLVELAKPKAGPIETSGPQFLIEMARRYAGELVLVATGPLTNLALASLLEPHWMDNLQKLVIMGGAVRCPGNVTPAAEANFHNDPEAAQAVLEGGNAERLVLVGLDVTLQTRIGWDVLAPLEARQSSLSPVAKLSLELLRFYTKSYNAAAQAVLHDPLAVGIAAQPDLVKTERMRIEIETQGQLTRGQSVGYTKAAFDQIENKGDWDDVVAVQNSDPAYNAQVCLEVRADEFVSSFRQRLGLS